LPGNEVNETTELDRAACTTKYFAGHQLVSASDGQPATQREQAVILAVGT
jgi:hypothetical protein